MIPRVFVSSTYYDLRHVRERLEKFIGNYGFEPILFESDKVTYQHGEEIDLSAYYEVGLCHVMVLVIGGRYGSPTTQNNYEEEWRKYDEDYISITRREFETATGKNIPVLIFIDRNVYSEYHTYKENQDFFDSMYLYRSKDDSVETKRFKFAHVDHSNIFKFIDLVKTKPIKAFEKVEEIENYLRIQFSGMFYLYLESLKKSAKENKVLDTISELNNVTLRMNEMLNSVGREILGKDKYEFEKVIESQFNIVLDFYLEKLENNLKFSEEFTEEEINQINLEQVADIIFEKALICNIPSINQNLRMSEWIARYDEITNTILTDLRIALEKISRKIQIESIDFRILNKDMRDKVLPFVTSERDKQKLLQGIKDVIYRKLTGDLPF